MRIAVLGAVCFDQIYPVEGDSHESFGGILYNAAALSSVLEDGDAVVPVSKLGRDKCTEAVAEFSKLPHVDTTGLTEHPGNITHVTLRWRSTTWRDEACLNMMPPYTIADLEPALDCDAAHVNFINGTEIDLDTLAAFRERFDGVISFDVHNIISRFGEDGSRTIVGFSQWRDWAPHLDVLQCNEFEIATMIKGEYKTRADYVAAAKEVCAAGPRAVSITLGIEGALTVHRKGDAYYAVDIDVLPPVKAIDTTGCGDSFSAGYLLGMLRFDDPPTALACASVVAGVNAQHTGIGELAEAPALLENPRAHFEVFKRKPDDWPGEGV